MSKLIIAVMLVIVVAWSNVTHGELVLVDVLGRYVVLHDTPRRVIVLAPSITELLAYLGVDDTIIGADVFSLNSWFADVGSRLRARNVTSVGGYLWTDVRVEKVIELQPDVVLADVGVQRPLLETFEASNVTVFYLHGGHARTVYDVYSDIHTLGLMFNRLDRAVELVRVVEREIAEKRALFESAGYIGVRVLIVVDFYGGIWVAGKATYIDDVLSRLGLVNAAGVYSWGLASVEQIAKWSPDLIIVACDYATEEKVREFGLYELNKPVVILNSTEVDIVSRPGPLLQYVPGVLYSVLSRSIQPKYSPVVIETTTEPTNTEIAEKPETRQEATQTETLQVFKGEEVAEPRLAILVAVAAVLGGSVGYVVGYKLRR